MISPLAKKLFMVDGITGQHMEHMVAAIIKETALQEG
jgi:hypothetical protein